MNSLLILGRHSYRMGILLAVLASAIALAFTFDQRQVGEGPVDLAVLGAVVSPTPGVAGEPLVLTVVVANLGRSPSQSSRLIGCDDDLCTDPVKIPELAPGQRLPVQATISAKNTSARASGQPYNFKVVVGGNDGGRESNLDNNQSLTGPHFIVVPFIPSDYVEKDHDDIFYLDQAAITRATRISYGRKGAPGDVTPTKRRKQILDPDPPAGNPAPKIDPLLLKEVKGANPGDRIGALMQVRSDFKFRRLPELLPGDRFSRENAPLLAKRQAAFEGLRRARMDSAVRSIADLVKRGSIELGEYFTLSNSFAAEFSAGDLELLAKHPAILHLDSLNQKGVYHDHDANNSNDLVDGRSTLKTDPYFNAGAEGGGFYFGVIDSGTRKSHTLFSSPNQIDFWRDCVNTASATCLDTGDPAYSPGDCISHGTKVAGIVNANSNLGNNWRGVADTTVDSWKTCSGGAPDCTTSVQRAFNAAALVADKVVSGSFGCGGDETSATAAAADAGYDAGVLMFFSNGNSGPGASTVGAPAAAHKAIGVGAFDISTGAQYGSQSEGPTNDGRIKPEIQAPNNADTADSASNTATGTLGGTSGAAPWASAAGMLLTDWFGSFSTSPGKIYAMLINYGENSYSAIDNTQGAGPFKLGTGGVHYSGSRTISSTGQNSYVDFSIPSGTSEVRAAIWWPEDVEQAHNDIDLRLEHPDGTNQGSSVFVNSVFEHVIIEDPAPGDWRIRIRGYSVASSPQTVYYAIRYGP